MTNLMVILHVIVCFLLITLVLIQRGRGSGLVESFAGVESMFGTKTSAFLTRTTTILSVIFFFTCLTLAILSVKQSRSLLSNVRTVPLTASRPITKPEAKAQTPAVAAPTQPATVTIPAQAPAKTQDSPKADQK